MVGILVSFWDGLFSGAMLVLGSANNLKVFTSIFFALEKTTTNSCRKKPPSEQKTSDVLPRLGEMYIADIDGDASLF